MERGGGHKVPPLAEELLAMGNDREKSVFFKGMASGRLARFQCKATYLRVHE